VQRHDSRHNEVIFHAEARWLSRGKVLERGLQLARVAGFPCSTRIPNIHSFSRQFLALFESEFCSWIVQFFYIMRKLTWAFRMYLQQHRKRQVMTHVTLKLMKVSLPAHEVCTTISMNKKK